MATTKTKKKAKAKATDTKKTKDKKTPREKLLIEAASLSLEFPVDATVKQLKALIQTKKLEADLPTPAPPPPTMSTTKLMNKDILVKVGTIGKTGPARLLQGLVDKDGVKKWKDLCVIQPTGAPRIVLKARVNPANLKLEQNVKEIRLMQDGVKGRVLESLKL